MSFKRRRNHGSKINVPEFITNAPWYMENEIDSTFHQKDLDKKRVISLTDQISQSRPQQSQDGAQNQMETVVIKTKFKAGSCENCGSMDHATKDCVQRPRKMNAKIQDVSFQTLKPQVHKNSSTSGERDNEQASGDNNEEDNVQVSYDEKRDRWRDYDPAQQMDRIKEWEAIEEAKRKLKQQQREQALQNKNNNNKAYGDGDDDDSDLDILSDTEQDDERAEYQYDPDDVEMKSKSLRIREDTAKYLLNIRSESARYNPKTRSMFDDPQPQTFLKGKQVDTSFIGDNFVRQSDDTTKLTEVLTFAWDVTKRNNGDVKFSLMGDPTLTEKMHREKQQSVSEKSTKTKKEDKVSPRIKKSLLDKYGGQEHIRTRTRDQGQQQKPADYGAKNVQSDS
ncbi:hypothetical protein MIR68_011263 [Amoeboaphelidium protococcarum]|nr:hypothetical protein MIR68_011263 [Amoeboaphelidium protococcarum]